MTAPPAEKPDNRKLPRLTPLERDERAAKALMLRNGQATYAQIADQLNISEQQARKDVARAIREWVRVPAEAMVDRQRSIMLAIMRVEFPTAVNKEATPAQRHAAQDKVLEVLRDERSLFGLNAPQRVTLGISEEEFSRAAVELRRVTGDAPLAALAGEVQDAPLDVDVVGDGWSNL